MHPGKRRALPEDEAGRMQAQWEHMKARIPSTSSRTCSVTKRFAKGLAKNTVQLFALFGLANLLIAKRRLLAFDGPIAS